MGRALSDRERLLRTVTEAQWQLQVLGLARFGGWRSAHFRPGLTRSGRWQTAVQGDGAGFPDLVLVRPPRLLFVELKRETGRVPDEQRAWLEALAATGTDVAVWRPRDQHVAEAVLIRGEPVPPLRFP